MAQGDLLQTPRDNVIESRMQFRFTDGSLLEETVTFTQDQVFSLKTYRLVVKGPAFKQDGDFALDRSAGRYRVETKAHDDGKVKLSEGDMELPSDLYNGLVPVIVRNLGHSAPATVHLVAFTPGPRLIQLEITPSGTTPLEGSSQRAAHRFQLKPKLGVLLKVFAAVAGRTPPDSHIWIVTEDVPAFLRFEGPLAPDGPVWRVDLVAPRLPE